MAKRKKTKEQSVMNRNDLKEEVEGIISSKNKPKKFARRLSILLTSRANHPVQVIYMKGVEIAPPDTGGRLPWVRVLRTDGGVGPYSTIGAIIFSDSVLTKKKNTRRFVEGLVNNWNNTMGVNL